MSWLIHLGAAFATAFVGYVIGRIYERLNGDKRYQDQLEAMRTARDQALVDKVALQLELAHLKQEYPFDLKAGGE